MAKPSDTLFLLISVIIKLLCIRYSNLLKMLTVMSILMICVKPDLQRFIIFLTDRSLRGINKLKTRFVEDNTMIRPPNLHHKQIMIPHDRCEHHFTKRDVTPLSNILCEHFEVMLCYIELASCSTNVALLALKYTSGKHPK